MSLVREEALRYFIETNELIKINLKKYNFEFSTIVVFCITSQFVTVLVYVCNFQTISL